MATTLATNTDDGQGNTANSTDTETDNGTLGGKEHDDDEGEEDFSDDAGTPATDNESDTDNENDLAQAVDVVGDNFNGVYGSFDPVTGLSTNTTVNGGDSTTESDTEDDFETDVHSESGIDTPVIADDVSFDLADNQSGKSSSNEQVVATTQGTDLQGEQVNVQATITDNASGTNSLSDGDAGEEQVSSAGTASGGDTETVNTDVASNGTIIQTLNGTIASTDPTTGIKTTTTDNNSDTDLDNLHDSESETDVRTLNSTGETDNDNANQTDNDTQSETWTDSENVTQTNPDGSSAGTPTTTTNNGGNTLGTNIGLQYAPDGSQTSTATGTETGNNTSSDPTVGATNWTNQPVDSTRLNDFASNADRLTNLAPPSTGGSGGSGSGTTPPPAPTVSGVDAAKEAQAEGVKNGADDGAHGPANPLFAITIQDVDDYLVSLLRRMPHIQLADPIALPPSSQPESVALAKLQAFADTLVMQTARNIDECADCLSYATRPGFWGGFVEGWQNNNVAPIRDRLIRRAEFQGDFTPGHSFELDAFQDLIGAKAIEGVYGHSLTGQQITDPLERTQLVVQGVADITGAGAITLRGVAMVPAMRPLMYPPNLTTTVRAMKMHGYDKIARRELIQTYGRGGAVFVTGAEANIPSILRAQLAANAQSTLSLGANGARVAQVTIVATEAGETIAVVRGISNYSGTGQATRTFADPTAGSFFRGLRVRWRAGSRFNSMYNSARELVISSRTAQVQELRRITGFEGSAVYLHDTLQSSNYDGYFNVIFIRQHAYYEPGGVKSVFLHEMGHSILPAIATEVQVDFEAVRLAEEIFGHSNDIILPFVNH